MLHCSSERRAITRGHAVKPSTAATRRRKDRGRESECSPSLRTGQAVFQRPALQLMGSTVRLRASRFRDRLWRYRPFTRAVVRLNSPASSKKLPPLIPVSRVLSIGSVHTVCSTHFHLALRASLSCLGSFAGVTADKFCSLICLPFLSIFLRPFAPRSLPASSLLWTL